VAVEALAASLEATAPITIAAAGGAQYLVANLGQPSGAWFWMIRPMPEELWLQMADENQAEHRANLGE
jgi:hypothetical protein